MELLSAVADSAANGGSYVSIPVAKGAARSPISEQVQS
jgi:hypothetical protein